VLVRRLDVLRLGAFRIAKRTSPGKIGLAASCQLDVSGISVLSRKSLGFRVFFVTAYFLSHSEMLGLHCSLVDTAVAQVKPCPPSAFE